MDNEQWIEKAVTVITDYYVEESISPINVSVWAEHTIIRVHHGREILVTELPSNNPDDYANLAYLQLFQSFNTNPLSVVLTRYPIQHVLFDIRCIGELDTDESVEALESLTLVLINQTHVKNRKTRRWNKIKKR